MQSVQDSQLVQFHLVSEVRQVRYRYRSDAAAMMTERVATPIALMAAQVVAAESPEAAVTATGLQERQHLATAERAAQGTVAQVAEVAVGWARGLAAAGQVVADTCVHLSIITKEGSTPPSCFGSKFQNFTFPSKVRA